MNVQYRALVVDDDTDICRLVFDRLQAMGHECDCVNCIEDARQLVNERKYSYVILDMELPVRYGSQPDINAGVFFLSTLRDKYTRDELPIIVITAKMDGGKNLGLPSQVFYREANDLLLKPLVSTGEHTLETSVQKFVEKKRNSFSPSSHSAEWLFREPDSSDSNVMCWRTISQSGIERRYSVEINSIRGRLLDCINKMRFKNPVISHMDLIMASGIWSERTYFGAKGGAPRGPLKGHVAWFRQKLGIKITYVTTGITVDQPED